MQIKSQNLDLEGMWQGMPFKLWQWEEGKEVTMGKTDTKLGHSANFSEK